MILLMIIIAKITVVNFLWGVRGGGGLNWRGDAEYMMIEKSTQI